MAVADVNGDGRPDALVANANSNTLGVLLNTTYLPLLDLVISTPGQTIAAGIYHNITVLGGGEGTLGGNVTATGTVTVADGGRLADGQVAQNDLNMFVLSGPASFTLAAGGTLSIRHPDGIAASGNSGAIQTVGARSFSSDASYSYSNAYSQRQNTGRGLPGRVRNLTAGAYYTLLSQATSVAQVLRLNGYSLVTQGNPLTLLSDASGTALLATSGLLLNSGPDAVNGNVTVQRYIDGSRNAGLGYRHYSSPVQATTVADLATPTGFVPVLTQAYNTSATPGTTTPFPNVFAYDQSRLSTVTSNYSAFDKGWVVPNSNTPLTPGQGYIANIGAAQVVDFVGTPTNGDVSVTLARNTGPTAADAGWALVGNPYPSPLDYSLVQPADRQNLDAAIYVVQSTGPYTGGYRSYVNGQSTGTPNDAVLASSQGFFVRVSAGNTSGTLTFHNSQRVTDYAQQGTFQRQAQRNADSRPALRLALAGAGLADEWVAYAQAGALPAFDSQYDAAKLPNPSGLNLSSLVAGTQCLAIDGQPAFAPGLLLPLAVGVPAAGHYTLAATSLHQLPAGLGVYLLDARTGQAQLLAEGSTYAFDVTAADAQATLTGRFALRFGPSTALAAAAPLSAATVRVYPNPAHGRFSVAVPGVAGSSALQVELRDVLGKLVRQAASPLPATGAHPGNGYQRPRPRRVRAAPASRRGHPHPAPRAGIAGRAAPASRRSNQPSRCQQLQRWWAHPHLGPRAGVAPQPANGQGRVYGACYPGQPAPR